MTIEQARRILDRVRDGARFPGYVVDQALRATGDLAGGRSR